MNDENPHLKEINRLKVKYDKIVKMIENEEISIFYAHFDVEELLKRSIILKKFLIYMKTEELSIAEITKLVDKLKQLSHDITDIIYIEQRISF